MKEIYKGKNQYFEGTLQLRNPSQEVIDFVENRIEKDRKCTVAKIVQLKNGYDFYLSSQRYLRSLGKKLSETFPGMWKESRKIFTRNHLTSKDVYRVTVLFRYFDIKKGQTIEIRGDKFEVVSAGKKLVLKNLKTQKKKTMAYTSLPDNFS